MYRNEFPILQQKIHEQDLIYFDNAATSQTPHKVIQKITEYYSKWNSNVHRGAHFLSQEATSQFEKARKSIANHVGVKDSQCIFTNGTTNGINTFVRSIEHLIKEGDEIIVGCYEHHSNVLPYQELCKRTGAVMKYVSLAKTQEFDYHIFEELVNEKTKIIALGLISNVLGEKLDHKRIKEAASFGDIILAYDAAQVIGHEIVNFEELGCDILFFSAHKCYGPTGFGCMIATQKLIEKMQPVEFGGGMIESVSLEEEKTTYKKTFEKMEAGTPNICGAVATQAAIEFIEGIGIKSIIAHEKELITYFFEKAQKVPYMIVYGTKNVDKKAPVISFSIEGKNSYDIATMLDLKGIAVREGAHCAQPLLEILETESTIRISFAMYNTKDEIDLFFEHLELILEMI